MGGPHGVWRLTMRMTPAFLLALCTSAGWASPDDGEPSGRLSLYLRNVDGHLSSPTTTAAIRQKVYFAVDVEATGIDGITREIGITVFDGNGREVLRATNAANASSGASFGYTIRRADMPGAWWAVATLDGKPLAELRFPVTAVPASRQQNAQAP